MNEGSPVRPGTAVPGQGELVVPAEGRVRLPRYSSQLARAFRAYSRGYLRRHFNALRLAREDRPDLSAGEPLVVYLNHPGWWDPLVGLALADRVFPGRETWAPIDAQALRKYRFFERIGFFGVEPGTPSGAIRFLRQGGSVLERQGAALWVTAEGRFTDPRVRPVRLQAGLGMLAARMRRGTILPLALEYGFWEERLPEAFAALGSPVRVEEHAGLDREGWTALLEHRLEETMDALAVSVQRRDPDAFETVLRGRSGVGGPYDLWRRLRARLRGERFDPAHGSGR